MRIDTSDNSDHYGMVLIFSCAFDLAIFAIWICANIEISMILEISYFIVETKRKN